MFIKLHVIIFNEVLNNKLPITNPAVPSSLLSVILHVAVLLDVLTRCQENSSRTYSLGFGTEPTSMSRMHTYVGV